MQKACSVIYKLRTDPRTFDPILEASPHPLEDFLKQRLAGYSHSKSMVATVVGHGAWGNRMKSCFHSVVTRTISRFRIFHAHLHPYTLAVRTHCPEIALQPVTLPILRSTVRPAAAPAAQAAPAAPTAPDPVVCTLPEA